MVKQYLSEFIRLVDFIFNYIDVLFIDKKKLSFVFLYHMNHDMVQRGGETLHYVILFKIVGVPPILVCITRNVFNR